MKDVRVADDTIGCVIQADPRSYSLNIALPLGIYNTTRSIRAFPTTPALIVATLSMIFP